MNRPAIPVTSLCPESEPTGAWPRRALRAAIFLIVIECLLLAFPSRSWIVPGGLVLVALSRLWTIRRGWVLQMPTSWNAVFLAVAFAVKYSVAPSEFPTDATFISTELAHEVGCWLVSFQLLILHDRRSLERVPVGVAALGCLVVLCAGDIRLHSVSRSMVMLLMMLLIGGMAWAAHAGREWLKLDQRRRLRRGLLLGTLVLAGVPAYFAARAWHRHERDLEMVLLQMMRMLDGQDKASHVRYRPPMIDVSEGKITLSETPTLLVSQAGPEPLYLRGRAFDLYRPSTWTASQERTTIQAVAGPPPSGITPQFKLFRLTPHPDTRWQSVTIQTLVLDDGTPYVPLETDYLESPLSELGIDHLQNLHLIDESRPEVWRAHLATAVRRTPPPEGDELALPKLDPRIVQLAEQLFAGHETTQAKIEAVEGFFHQNFEYRLGIDVPAGQDPVTYFLLNQQSAHCEFFATAAAVLLRLGGVPTRYVTGYVPSENHGNGRWLARRKDAHAWVEAYDAQRQVWTIVEATPSDGVPELRTANWSERQREAWRAWYVQFKDSVARQGIWKTALSQLQSLWVRGMLVALLGWAWWTIARRHRTPATRPPVMSASHAQRSLHEWLHRIEARVAAKGVVRAPHETLLHFRDRLLSAPQSDQLRSTADWIADYAEVRYNETAENQQKWLALEALAAKLV